MPTQTFRTALLAVIAVAVLQACATAQPERDAQPLLALTTGPFIVSVSAAGDEETELTAAVAMVEGILGSQAFWTNLRDVASGYQRIYVGPNYQERGLPAGMASARGALQLLQAPGSVPIHPDSARAFRVAKAIIGLTGTYWDKGEDFTGQCSRTVNGVTKQRHCRATEFAQGYSNMLVVTHGIGPSQPGIDLTPNAPEVASIEIGREVFKRFKNGHDIGRSCTVNTIAHELAHTISYHPSLHFTVVQDEAPTTGTAPTLSYLFGSVAQCTWHAQNAPATVPGGSLRACVQRMGVREFRSLQCAGP